MSKTYQKTSRRDQITSPDGAEVVVPEQVMAVGRDRLVGGGRPEFGRTWDILVPPRLGSVIAVASPDTANVVAATRFAAEL